MLHKINRMLFIFLQKINHQKWHFCDDKLDLDLSHNQQGYVRATTEDE